MATSTPTRPPHIIDAPVRRRPGVPEGWLRGLVAGAESASFSLLALIVPAVATYVATAAAPALGEASWQAAAGVGAGLWLLGHGAPFALDAATSVSLVPLGATLLSLGLVHVATRRMRLPSAGASAFVPVGYLAVVLGALRLAPGTAVWPALAGGLAVALVGMATAQARSAVPAPAWWQRRADRVPGLVRAGLRGAGWMGAGLALLALLAGAAAAVAGWDRVVMIHDGYTTDPVSTVVMVLAQVLYVPTALVWAIAWIAGPGFAVGAGTAFTSSSTLTAPLPALPILGALPSPGTPGLGWVVVLPAVVGSVVGIWLDRRRRQEGLPGAIGAALVAAGTVALAAVVLCAAGSGGIGTGRMAEIGPQPWAVGAMLLAELGAGAVAAVVALHPSTHAGVRAAFGDVRDRVTGRHRGAARDPGSARDTSSARDASGGRERDGGAWGIDHDGATPVAAAATVPPPAAPTATTKASAPASASVAAPVVVREPVREAPTRTAPPPAAPSARTGPSAGASPTSGASPGAGASFTSPDGGDEPAPGRAPGWTGPTLSRWKDGGTH